MGENCKIGRNKTACMRMCMCVSVCVGMCVCMCVCVHARDHVCISLQHM